MMKEQVEGWDLIPGEVYEDHPEKDPCPQLEFIGKEIRHKKLAYIFKVVNGKEVHNDYIEEDGLVYISTGGRYYKPFKI